MLFSSQKLRFNLLLLLVSPQKLCFDLPLLLFSSQKLRFNLLLLLVSPQEFLISPQLFFLLFLFSPQQLSLHLTEDVSRLGPLSQPEWLAASSESGAGARSCSRSRHKPRSVVFHSCSSRSSRSPQWRPVESPGWLLVSFSGLEVGEETLLLPLLLSDAAGLELVLLPPGRTGRDPVPDPGAGLTGLTKVLEVQQLLRNLLLRQLRLRLGLSVERPGRSDRSPPVLTGQPVGGERWVE